MNRYVSLKILSALHRIDSTPMAGASAPRAQAGRDQDDEDAGETAPAPEPRRAPVSQPSLPS